MFTMHTRFLHFDENIAKTREKAGLLFSANFVIKCVNPMSYLKFWKQACIPTSLFGVEIYTRGVLVDTYVFSLYQLCTVTVTACSNSETNH